MKDLNEIAKDTYNAILRSVDACQAVKNAVGLDAAMLKIGEREFRVDEFTAIYTIAIGKAAFSMVRGLREKFGEKLKGGVISGLESDDGFPGDWSGFHGGHPIPNEESINAGKSAGEFLKRVDSEKTLIIFLISGGGSAMFELPADGISLGDLQKTNQILVNCGAKISEINMVRSRLSFVKGGGLIDFAPRSKKVTLIISDTNYDEPQNVASGPTIRADFDEPQIGELISKYGLAGKLPQNVLQRLNAKIVNPSKLSSNPDYTVLLDNRNAIDAARIYLNQSGFVVQTAEDLVENEINFACTELVKRLAALRIATPREKPAAIISGGEFVCPVRGNGIGGRSLESALRTSILFDDLKKHSEFAETRLTALFAGTDGIDGNSPATGAICSDSTICRAKVKNLSAQEYLERSDSFGFFAELDDLIITGSTGTNVRDIRILLAD